MSLAQPLRVFVVDVYIYWNNEGFPPILAYWPPRIPLKIPRVHCPPLACFIP